MSKHLKQLVSLLLCIVMVLGMLPTFAFADDSARELPEAEAEEVVTPEHEAELQADVMGDIASYYSRMTKRSTYIDKKDFYDATEDIKEIVLASDTYVEGSIRENLDDDGNCVGFYWQTTTGITCGYFPEHEYKMAVMRANNTRASSTYATASACTNYNNSQAGANDVCLIGPMYSEDTSFTEQYGNEAASIAAATGGTAWKLINSNATVTNIANAISKCRVVIFDSHGNTDWGYFDGGSDGSGEADCVTKANTSYLCLSSGTGINSTDMAYVSAVNPNSANNTFCHAYKDSSGNYVIDGTAIANHMSTNASNSMLWMAICLGMATDGMAAPLREKGVDVVYGYSQSVSFTGEYDYEEDFWTKMKAGETVATAFSYMTRTYKWDPAYATSYKTIAKARYNYVAFPNVVSAQDTYQGQRSKNPSSATDSTANTTAYNSDYGACNIQDVNSTWTLATKYEVTATTSGHGTVTVDGMTINCTPDTGYYVSAANVTNGTATATINGNTVTVSASSACTVNIVFSPKTACTIQYYANDSQMTLGSAYTSTYVNDTITLPTTATAVANWNFAGWSTAVISDTTTKPSYYAPGASYTPTTANPTLYAVYTKTEGGTTGGGTWTLMTNADKLASGLKIVIASNAQGKTAGDISSSVMGEVATTFATGYGTIDTLGNDTVILTVGGSEGAWTLTNENGQLLGATAVKKLAWNDGTTTWSISISGDNATIQNGNSNYGRFLHNTSTPRFTTYTSSTSTSMLLPQIYYQAGSAGTTTYTTSPFNCSHENVMAHPAVAATCGAAGSSAYWSCDDCGAYFSDASATTSIAADSWVIAATGNHTLNGSYISDGASGHHQTCSVCGQAGATVAHTFDSGVVNSGDGSTTYTCTTCGYNYTKAASTDYTLGTELNSGDKVLIYYPAGPSAVSSTASGSVLTASSNFTKNDNTITLADDSDVAVFTVEFIEETSNFTLKTSDNKYLTSGATGNSLTLETTATDYSQWYLEQTGSNSTVYIRNTNAAYSGKYNQALEYYSSSGGFTVYGLKTSDDRYIYELYINSHTHNLTHHTAVAATCTSAGNSEYWTCTVCGKYFSNANATTETTPEDINIAATGHDYVAGSTVAATCTAQGYTPYTCSRCGATENRDTTAALGHNWGAWTVTSTTRSHTCSVCNTTESFNIPQTTPEVLGYNVTPNSDVLVNAVIDVPTSQTGNLTAHIYEGAIGSATVTDFIDGKTPTEVPVNTAAMVSQGYMFTVSKPAKNIQDDVTLLLHDGTNYVTMTNSGDSVEWVTYSVENYLEFVIANNATYEPNYPGITDLCRAMQAYGHYAQLQQDYIPGGSAAGAASAKIPVEIDTTTAKEINAINTSSLPAAAATPSTTTNSIDGLSFYGASLVMLSEMTLRFYFKYDGTGTLNCNNTPLTQSLDGNYWYVDVTGIAAKDFGVGKTVTVTDGTNTCTVAGYSVNRYIYNVLNNPSAVDTNMLNLAKAIAYYGIKATNYSNLNP